MARVEGQSSEDMASQHSDQDDSDQDDLYNYYGDDPFDVPMSSDDLPGPSRSASNSDPEYFEYKCLAVTDVERLLNESVEALCSRIPVTPALAKVLLHHHKWDVEMLVNRYKNDCHQLLIDTHLKPPQPVATAVNQRMTQCPVCCRASLPCSEFRGLACAHQFCRNCWLQHCEVQLQQTISTGIGCMESACCLLAPEDSILNLLSSRSDLRDKYQQLVFQDHVNSHPNLRFCAGNDCATVIEGKTMLAKKVCCKTCGLTFCFLCAQDYHAPTDCALIKRWLVKCADDSETANYISAHTKDCPNCHSCIEKNGGCNHMQCSKCKHHFCWMCLGDWKTHGSEYYECSRYKENPAVATETVHVKARRALEKYLHYYERYENHNKSLQMEQQLVDKIKQRIEEKVNKHEGTWIDWQYLYDAARLLTKCRYTLQYTYPYAFYLEPGPPKEIFEYQQAALEKEIEELSWKVERAQSTDRASLEAQMNIAEKKRLTLLQSFFDKEQASA